MRLLLNSSTTPVISTVPPRRITLRDIARQAGVSTGTVSMVLNNSPLIAMATRSHVQHVLHELGYVYDRGAGQMRSKRSHLVGVSVCDLVNPHVSEVIAGLQEALQELGLVLILGDCAGSTARQLHFLQMLREYNVAGLLMTPALGTPKSDAEQLSAWQLPVVQVARCMPGLVTDYVGTDNRHAAQLATRHLLALGHEQIAYIGLDRRSSTSRECLAGFLRANRQAGRAIAAERVIECGATREGGYDAVSRLYGSTHPPSAVVCLNESVASGAMLALRRLGVEPGRDCSVIALDDSAEATMCAPALTTVAVEASGICRAACHLLSTRMAEPQLPIRHLLLEPRLVERASCGRLQRTPAGRVRRTR